MPLNPAHEEYAKEGKLYIVSTPVGNLADITLRAIETLRAVDLIAAEDTRHTRKLLSYYDIHKPLVSYHEHNARQKGGVLLDKIASGMSIALVTDAGTPCVSDPGELLVEEALQRGIEPVVIPGPTALISALIVSGLSTHPFTFLGFPPARGVERRRFFQKYASTRTTLILYESPKKLLNTLRDLLQSWGERRVAVARELTKVYEEVFRGPLSQAAEYFSGEVRGELTLVVEGQGSESNEGLQSFRDFDPDLESSHWRNELKALLSRGLSSREAVSAVAARFNLPRRLVYETALALKKS